MKTRSRVLMLLGVSVIAVAAIALGFFSHRSDDLEPVAARVDGPGAPPAAEPSVSAANAAGVNDSAAAPFEIDPHTNYLALGQNAYTRGDYAACVEHLQRAAVQDPQRFQVQYLLGLGLRLLGRYEESNVALDKAIEIAPHDARALVNSARTLLDLKRPDEAEVRARLAVEASPSYGEAWNLLGRTQLALSRLAEAEVSFARACEVDSTNAYAHNNLGLLRLQRGEWQEAATQLEAAVRLKDDVAYFHNNLGLAYERQGRMDDAARCYARTLELQPKHAMAQIALARLKALGPPALAQAGAADSAQIEPAAAVKP